MPTRKEVEKTYSKKDVIRKLRRFADCLESEKSFSIQISGKKISIPPNAVIEFEFETSRKGNEVEIEISWKSP